jgi:hypothetical protein
MRGMRSCIPPANTLLVDGLNVMHPTRGSLFPRGQQCYLNTYSEVVLRNVQLALWTYLWLWQARTANARSDDHQVTLALRQGRIPCQMLEIPSFPH